MFKDWTITAIDADATPQGTLLRLERDGEIIIRFIPKELAAERLGPSPRVGNRFAIWAQEQPDFPVSR